MGTWIEIHRASQTGRLRDRRSLRGNVDRNTWTLTACIFWARRSLRGNVDRNTSIVRLRSARRVVPYVGTWIEILDPGENLGEKAVVPYVGTWIEMQSIPETNWALTVVPYVGTWIEMV